MDTDERASRGTPRARLLDTEPERRFDRVVRLAHRLFLATVLLDSLRYERGNGVNHWTMVRHCR